MAEEKKVKAVLSIGGEIGSTLRGTFNAITGNIFKIGEIADDAFRNKMGSAIREATRESKSLTAEIKKTGDVTGALGIKLGSVARSLKQNEAILNVYNAGGNAIGKFGRGLAVVTAEATATGWALFHLNENFSNTVLDTSKQAQKLGMSAQNLSMLRYAAGSDFEAVTSGMRIFEKNMLTGSKNTVEALNEIGLSYEKLNKLSPTQQLLAVSEAMSRFKGNKTGIAQLIFGKGGAEMLPFLDKGAAKIKELMREAKELGLVITEEDIADAKRGAAVERRLKGTFAGIKLQMGRAFNPVFDQLSETFTELMGDKEVRKIFDDIGASIKEMLPDSKEIKQWLLDLRDNIKWLKNNVWPVVESFGGWKLVIGALVAIPFAPFIGSVVQLGIALVPLIPIMWNLGASVIAATWPFLVIGGAIALFGYAIKKANDVVTSIGEGFSNLRKRGLSIPQIFGEIGEAIGILPAGTTKFIGETVDAMFKGFSSIKTIIFDSVSGAFDALKNTVAEWFGWIGSQFASLGSSVRGIFGGKSGGEGSGDKQVAGARAAGGPVTAGLSYLVGERGPEIFTPSTGGNVAANRGGTGSRVDNRQYNITVNALPSMDVEALANLVMSRLEGRQAALAGGALYD